MASKALQYELDQGVALLRLDDAKANAVSHALIESLTEALDRAQKEAAAVLLVGRPGRFSAGFDLKEMGTADSARSLVTAGAELMMRLFSFPRPVVAACTGHALAAGALLLLSSDLRVGADVEARIGLNEVAIGMKLPLFLVELAQHRLSKRHLSRAITQAEMYSPASAVDAGFLDRVVPEAALFETALGEARRLAQLPDPAFRNAKLRERGALVKRVRATLAEDMKDLTGPQA